MSIKMVTYNPNSENGKKLQAALGAELIHTAFHESSAHLIVNWGCSGSRATLANINPAIAVAVCVSKMQTYLKLSHADIPCPIYCRDRDQANSWLRGSHVVYARQYDDGAQGSGITVCKPGREASVPPALFYTLGFAKTREFRVYVWRGEVLQTYEKKPPRGVTLDFDVCASDDWLYCRDNLSPYPAALEQQSVRAVRTVGLDFGGVDVAIDADGNVCVFEVNSAPWLSPSVTTKLAERIKALVPSVQATSVWQAQAFVPLRGTYYWATRRDDGAKEILWCNTQDGDLYHAACDCPIEIEEYHNYQRITPPGD